MHARVSEPRRWISAHVTREYVVPGRGGKRTWLRCLSCLGLRALCRFHFTVFVQGAENIRKRGHRILKHSSFSFQRMMSLEMYIVM